MEINLETRLNKAFCENRDDEVIRLCSMTAEGALLKCSVHNHTVLHVACYSKKFQLANQLIEQLPENMLCELPYRTNNWGCTILHDASTSNKGLDLVRKLLQIAPQLLHARNNWGETAVFQTSRYGKWKNFEFLAGEVDKFCEVHKEVDHLQFFQRDDKTTILHMAILAGNYGEVFIRKKGWSSRLRWLVTFCAFFIYLFVITKGVQRSRVLGYILMGYQRVRSI